MKKKSEFKPLDMVFEDWLTVANFIPLIPAIPRIIKILLLWCRLQAFISNGCRLEARATIAFPFFSA